MNHDIFRSMREQMSPSEGAQAALREKLAAPSPAKQPAPWRKYAAVAACAAVILAAIPIYNAARPHDTPGEESVRLHSYTLAEGGVQTSTTESATEDLGGSQEADPTPEPAAGGMETVGFVSQDEAQGLYNGLMDYFYKQFGGEPYAPALPDWYGGGYLDNDRPDHIARLTLVLVEDLDTPELRQEILDALGSDHVDFVSGKYALSFLTELQKQILEIPGIRDIFAGSGVYERENRVHVELIEVTDAALAALSELDPEDDAIYVTVGQRASVDLAVDDVAGTVSHPAEPAGPGNYADGTVIAEEPQILRPGDDGYVEPAFGPEDPIRGLPGKLPAVEKAPAGTLEGNSPAYDPNEAKLPAVVLEVNGSSVLVECTADDGGLREGDQVTFSWTDTALSPGDHITVVFDGDILETWPARLGEVRSVLVTD